MMASLTQERGSKSYEWKIKLRNLVFKEFPLRRFQFDFADITSREQYIKYWASNMYPQGSTPDELEERRLPAHKILKGKKAIAYLGLCKGDEEKYKFFIVDIQEDYTDRSTGLKIKCFEPRKQKTVFVPINCLFDLAMTKTIELTGLEGFEYATEFKKLIFIEEDLTAILTVKSPVWKGSHCSAILWNGKSEISVNEKLETAMLFFLKYQKKMMNLNSLGFATILSTTLCSINTDVDSWISETPPYSKPTLRFHVSEIAYEQNYPKMIIHPIKYWQQFKQMEKNMQDYGEHLPELGRSFEEKGSFLIAAREEEDRDGNKIFKFFRGWHTGEISIEGGTHKIALLDYSKYLWVENGNMLPLLPKFCNVPMMGAISKPLVAGRVPEDELLLREFKHQHCAGTVENVKRLDLFSVFTINRIKAIPHHRFFPT